MSKSEVGGVRRAYETPTACIVAVGPGCVVRASGWTTTQFQWQGDEEYGGLWGSDNSSSASAFQWQQDGEEYGGLWSGENSSSASAFQWQQDGEEYGGLWGGDNSSSASAFEEDTGRW